MSTVRISTNHLDELDVDGFLKELEDNAIYIDRCRSTKNLTFVCRDCEFRNMCLDSRIPFKSLDFRIWRHHSECGYNPYIAKWNTEEGYQTVAESIADGVVSEEFVYRP